ncbi:hypothetical protein [Lysinibacillus sp. LZ02]|uniref:hypothetical protein n=1 Tax=Lysinibacillus sp. LZ02 TaxID=3420668 RepID=UPI003D36BF9E
MMTNIINFLQHKNEKDEQIIRRYFQKAYSLDERLDQLIQDKDLQVEDHKLFLAFLAYLEQQRIDPQQLFKDVIDLPKFKFEAKYNMNWGQVVKLSVTFLTILRTNDLEGYKQFTR